MLAGIEGGSRPAVLANLNLFDVMDYWDAWLRNGPPTYISMAASIGYKSPDKVEDDAEFDRMLAQVSQGTGHVG